MPQSLGRVLAASTVQNGEQRDGARRGRRRVPQGVTESANGCYRANPSLW